MVRIAPSAVVAHGLLAHFHQRQATAVVVGLVVFPDVVVRRHVVRTVTAVVQLVATKGGVVRHIDIQRIAHKADVVVENLRALGVVELDAIAALGRVKLALAGDEVAINHYIGDLLNPQAKQVVGQVTVAHHGAVRARKEVNAGVLSFQAAAGVAHDQALNHHVGGGDADGVAHHATAEGRPVNAAQCQRFIDQQIGAVEPALHLNHVAGGGGLDGGLQILSWLDDHGGGAYPLRGHPTQQRKTCCAHHTLHNTSHPIDLNTRNSTAPIIKFLKPT